MTEQNHEQVADNVLEPTYLVAIGASAGGLEVLEKLFTELPINSGMAFVVIQHLSPNFKSVMDELLQRCTQMPVTDISEEMSCQPNHVYLMPPNREITISGNVLIPHVRSKEAYPSLPINLFMKSLAIEWNERAVAIILSGTGSDGSIGIRDIQQNSGTVIVQRPDTCRFDGMPRSAIDTNCVDAVLAPEEMSKALQSLAINPALFHPKHDKSNEEPEKGLNAIFEGLQEKYSIDFSKYKATTVNRRIYRRMAFQGGELDIDRYAESLKSDDYEQSALYRDLLIGVTRFFRNEEAFSALQTGALNHLLDSLEPKEDLRVWVCGCSTGEEAYTLCMLIHEEMKALGRTLNFKIFATDLHPESLRVAADGVYSAERLSNVPHELRARYFISAGHNEYRVTQELRRHIIFSEHNLIKDPPFTRIHLVTCRNLLIYFEPEIQRPALAAFSFSLLKGGYLMLGSSETLGNLSDDFDVIDRRWKIYRKSKSTRGGFPLKTSDSFSRLSSVETFKPREDRTQPLSRLYTALLERYIPTGFLLNEHNALLHVFGQADQYMKAPSGQVSAEVFSLLSTSLSIALNSALHVIKEGKSGRAHRSIFRDTDGAVLELSVETLSDPLSGNKFYMVVLKPQTRLTESLPELPEGFDLTLTQESAGLIRQLRDELTHTKLALQSNAEELESSNEELQASNEELLASNEELQSTNEELHSVNEELYTVNSEHENKIVELDRLSKELQDLVGATNLSLIFITSQFKIKAFTPKSVEIFSLVNSDIGRDIRDFMPRFQDPTLNSDLSEAMGSKTKKEVILRRKPKAHSVTGLMKRSCIPYIKEYDSENGIILSYMDVTEEQYFRLQTELLYQSVIQDDLEIALLNQSAEVLWMSPKMLKIIGLSDQEYYGKELKTLLSGFLSEHAFNPTAQSGQFKLNNQNMACLPWGSGDLKGWLIKADH